MRIMIDKHTNVGEKPDGSLLWVISPGAGEDLVRDVSYHIEVEHDWSPDPDRITRVAHQGGVRSALYPDRDFKTMVEAFIENETKAPEGMSRSEAIGRASAIYQSTEDDQAAFAEMDRLGIGDFTDDEVMAILNEEHNRFSYSQASTLGFNPTIFAELERGWAAAKVFLDFGVTR